MRKRQIFRLLFILGIWVSGLTMFAQQSRLIQGKVVDNRNEPLPGVNIIIKGTVSGTVSDIDGNYQLQVNNPEQAVLVYRFIGFDEKEIAVSNQTTINVTLEESSIGLDEVVAIGYGTVRRRDITGSVASVGGDALQAVPVSSAAEAITGRLAGVQITTTEGSPDAELRIRVRGGGSITGDNTPLLIVDGFPVESISDIPASDIESIDVLKDASSTAIYGARGANGVIIVTTKRGQEGRTSVSYNAYYGVKKIAKTLDVLDVQDYLKWQYEYALLNNSGEADSYEKYFGIYDDRDMFGSLGNNWQDQIYGRVGEVFNHNLGITGGTDKIRYAFSYAHIGDKAIMIGSDFTRDNLSLKLTQSPNKKLTLDYSVRYADTRISGGGANEQNEVSSADSRLKHTVIYTPVPMKSIGGDTIDEEENSSSLVNPFLATRDNEREQRRKTFNLSASLDYEVFDGFKFRSEIGMDYYNDESDRYFGMSTYYVKNRPSADNQNKPAVELRNTQRNRLRNTNTINYDFKNIVINRNHSLRLLFGQEILETDERRTTNIVHGFPEGFDASTAFKLTTQGAANSIDYFYLPDDKLLSFFGRVNYDFSGKYIFSGTFRADGSSKFSEGNRWGYFPSAAFAWRMSSERFMENTQNWLDDLKLRFSYGTAGNNNIPSGQMAQTFFSNSSTWIHGFPSYLSTSKQDDPTVSSLMANPDLKWETTYTRNLGLDFAVLRSRISGSVEVYLNTTEDLLIRFPVSGTGYNFQYRNMGETENKGLEVQLNGIVIDRPNYGFNVGFNIGFNQNEIKSLGIMEDFGESSGWASTEIPSDYWVNVGGSVGKMYGYLSDGRYEISDFQGFNESTNRWVLNEGIADASSIIGTIRPGMMKLKNIVGSDNAVNIDDRTIIGDANPLHTGGLILNGRVHNFDVTAAFNWSYGNDVYNANKVEYTSTSKYQYRNLITEMADGNRWTNLTVDGKISNDPQELATLNANTTLWSPYMSRFVFSDWAVEDGSFLRLNTLSVGYTVPNVITQRANIQNLRFYVTGYNVFLLTNYSGYDPEVSTRRRTALTPGVDYSAYPKSRQLVFGVNLNF
jgi:TonB-dependent starch-binding outer membrane protein SusC